MRTVEGDAERRGGASRALPRSILVVDDDAAIRDAVALALTLEGYAVLTAENGLDALLALHAESRPDAIILDLEMPVMSGLEFRAAQLRDPALAGIPVIVLSSSSRTIRADRRLPKPFDAEALLQAVRELAGAP